MLSPSPEGIAKFYMESEEISKESILKFVDDIYNYKVSRFYKSEKLPTDNDQRIIKKVVGRNFNQTVTDSNKDFLLELFSEMDEKSNGVF